MIEMYQNLTRKCSWKNKKIKLRKHTNLQQWRGGTIARKLAPAHYLVTAKICTNGKIWRFTQPSSPTKIKGGCLEGKPIHFLAKKNFSIYFHLPIVIEGGCFGQRRQVERRKSSGKWELLNSSSSPSSALSPLATGSHLFFSGFRPSCPPMVMAAPSPSPTLTIHQPLPCADMWPKTNYASSITWVFYQGYPSSTIHTAKSHKWWLYFTNSLNFLNLDLKRWISVTHLVLQHCVTTGGTCQLETKPSQSNWANIVRKIFSNIYKYFPMWGVSDFTISVSCRWLNHLFPEISIPWKIPLAEILKNKFPLRQNYHNGIFDSDDESADQSL